MYKKIGVSSSGCLTKLRQKHLPLVN